MESEWNFQQRFAFVGIPKTLPLNLNESWSEDQEIISTMKYFNYLLFDYKITQILLSDIFHQHFVQLRVRPQATYCPPGHLSSSYSCTRLYTYVLRMYVLWLFVLAFNPRPFWIWSCNLVVKLYLHYPWMLLVPN